jgi:hypothetical protein
MAEEPELESGHRQWGKRASEKNEGGDRTEELAAARIGWKRQREGGSKSLIFQGRGSQQIRLLTIVVITSIIGLFENFEATRRWAND